MRVLLCNDDGIYAPGLAAIHQELAPRHDVQLVAPDRAMSGESHALTIRHPVIWKEIKVSERMSGVAVEGTPADCIKLAFNALLPQPPELVVSGINDGLNTGIHVLYSGTVAAAMEAAILGSTAIAVSMQRAPDIDFARGAKIAMEIIDQILRQKPAPRQVFNINIPRLKKGWPVGVRVVPQSIRPTMDKIERRTDPNGRPYYWLTGDFVEWDDVPETDIHSIREGYVTVTPLQFNLTSKEDLAAMRDWKWSAIGA